MIAFLSLYVIAGAGFPDRFLAYGWLFGFPPLVLTILKTKYKYLRRIGVLLLVAFMLFNIFSTNSSLWSPRSGETSATIVMPLAPSVEDYALANRFAFSNGTILAPENSVMAIYDVHNILGTFFTSSEVNLTNFDWIIVPKDTNTTTLTVLNHSIDYNRIYDSNSLSVFKRR